MGRSQVGILITDVNDQPWTEYQTLSVLHACPMCALLRRWRYALGMLSQPANFVALTPMYCTSRRSGARCACTALSHAGVPMLPLVI